MIFRYKSIEFEISPLFFIIVSSLLLLDKSGYMSYSLLFSLLHELGHIAMMLLLKKPPKKVNFMFYGLEIKTKVFTELETIFISLAGPFINIFIAMFFLVLSKLFSIEFDFIILINLVFGAFNLLPINCLDGGDLLFSFLRLRFNDNTSKKVSKIISLIFAFLILVFGSILVIYGNFGILSIGIYLFVCNLIKSD